MKIIKLIPTLIIKSFIKAIHKVFSLVLKVNSKKITFASYRSDELNGNLFFVWKEIRKKYPDYKCTLSLKKFNSSYSGKIRYIFHMIKGTYHMATSKYFIIDDYYLPLYLIKPREDTEIIQLWHASGALKKFGWSTVGKTFGPSKEYLKHVKIHSNYSKVYVSSSEVVPYYSEAFGMSSDRIHPLGIPRTDFFYDEKSIRDLKQRFYKTFPSLNDKKLLLYAPTYRGKSHYQERYKCPLNISRMNEALGEEYILLIHLHPYMKSEVTIQEQDKDFAHQIKGDFNIQELLSLTNILITDYSTVFFDFSLLNRPIAFFADDLEEYIEERDFYYDYKKILPGPLFKDTYELIEWINEGSFDQNKVKDFRNRFFDNRDGNASGRITEHILNK